MSDISLEVTMLKCLNFWGACIDNALKINNEMGLKALPATAFLNKVKKGFEVTKNTLNNTVESTPKMVYKEFTVKGGLGFVTSERSMKTFRERVVKEYLKKNGNHIRQEPFMLSVDVYFKIPKNYSLERIRKCRQSEIQPMDTPKQSLILDNVLEALEGVAFDRKEQCMCVVCGKTWSKETEGKIVIKLSTEDK